MNSLDGNATTGELAKQAYQSRTQFHRLFRALVEETPAAMRRRLLLERAAFHLGSTDQSVTELVLDANYGSLEAFTRAFRKAFGTSPSLYRRMKAKHVRLPSPNGIHFHSPGFWKGEFEMDLFDRFAGNDSWHTRQLLEAASTLTDEQLDQPLKTAMEILPWREKTDTVRQLLENIVYTKEVWAAALTGGQAEVKPTPKSMQTPKSMLERMEKADEDLQRSFRRSGCPAKLGRYVHRRTVRTSRDVYVWRRVRPHHDVQRPPASVGAGWAQESRRGYSGFWRPHGIRAERGAMEDS